MSFLSALNYTYTQEDSKDALFVFDTNYFLYAYQSYTNGDSYIKALENKKKDIYIPFITYIEFLSNLNSVTSSLKDDIRDLENYVNLVVEEVKILDIQAIKQKLKSESFKTKSLKFDRLNNLLKKDVEKKIDDYVENSVKEIESKCNEIEKILNEKLKEFSDLDKKLPKLEEYNAKIKALTDRIDELFKSTTVLGEMYTQGKIDEYISDMDDRYEKKIPPGFCDEGKGVKQKIFGDLVIPDKAGDLILWKDLINILCVDEKKKEKYSKVIIVTNDGLSDKKSDWRIKLGKEGVVHDQLKIEFYKKTGKLLDLMKVEDFIKQYSKEDEFTNKLIANEIKTFKELKNSKEEKIEFTLLGEAHTANNQKEMMEKIFITVIDMKGLRYRDLISLPCISTKHEELNTTFDSYKEVLIDEENEIILGTRLNRTDKLRYINRLFIIAGFDQRDLIFESIELHSIWRNLIKNNGKIIH